MKKRKHILLRNEITGIQMQLKNQCYYSKVWINRICDRLEELKSKWYKVRKKK